MDLLCPMCGAKRAFDDLNRETEARYLATFGVTFKADWKVSRYRANTRYDRVYREVTSEWRSIGCEAAHMEHE